MHLRQEGRRPIPLPERLDHGLVFSLDGVGGYDWGPRWLRTGLDQAGVNYAVNIFDWGHGPAGMWVTDLWDEKGNHERAAELARMIQSYQTFYPNRPVYLIGHSGGAGLVVFALEQLPANAKVDAVFLLAPALVPDRNLAPALRHVRSACYATYSSGDLGLMGLGTEVFTTMDGKHSVGAGLVGFKLPANLSEADRAEYRKLYQAKQGFFGTHMDSTTAAFVRTYIAPVLQGRPADPIFQPLLADAAKAQERQP